LLVRWRDSTDRQVIGMHRLAFRALLLVVTAGLIVIASAGRAQDYPSRPVRLVVGFAPGGVADVTARVLAQRMGELLGQQVVVDNRPSAGGIVAAEVVAKSKPDGYTLLLMTNGNAVSQSLWRSLPYDTRRDFAPVSTVGFFDVAIVASTSSRIDSVKALLDYAKANPGKLDIGTINVGSTQNLAAELFRSMSGIDATIVPFKGSPAVVTALRGDEVEVAFEMLAPIIPQAQSGALRILAVGSERRYPGMPDVPTIAESGLPGYAASSWNAIAVPAGTPVAVVGRLNGVIQQAVATPEVREKLGQLGVSARGSTPGQMRQLVEADIDKWRRVIDDAKIERQ
jgi:tripartite-type tricarboxylate transporter receptor subunit TctC